MAEGRGFVAIILAAGKGKRMRSQLPKVMRRLGGRSLVHYVIDLAHSVGSERVLLVVGYRRDEVVRETRRSGVEWVVQEPQLGTGDAIRACLPVLKGYQGDLLILSGDVPLLDRRSVEDALRLHRETGSAATVFTFIPGDPTGYGRIIRGEGGQLLRIVEEKDAEPVETAVREVNGGVYLFRASKLFPALELLSDANAAREYYITDSIAILADMGERLSACLIENPLELAGVNNRRQLALLEAELARRTRGGVLTKAR